VALKLVMVNDCAYVGETLIKYLPTDVEAVHLKRSRRFWDKTLGIAWKIWRAKADVFHVHYLLQDCYLTIKFGKRPVVGHAHGSDLRTTLKHPVWGRIVRYNLKNSDQVLISTPDVLGQAKAFREDAEYFPNPVDMKLFYPKPFVPHGGKKRVLIASDSNWRVKKTDLAVKALSRIKEYVDVSIIGYGADFERTVALARILSLRLNVLPKVPHERMNEYYWNSDVVIDRFTLGSLGVVSLEAIACGRPIVTFVSSEYLEYKDFPLKDVNEEDSIADEVNNATYKLWERQFDYLQKNHSYSVTISKMLNIYRQRIEALS